MVTLCCAAVSTCPVSVAQRVYVAVCPGLWSAQSIVIARQVQGLGVQDSVIVPAPRVAVSC